MGRLRISAISFLNTAPLMWDFENGVTAEECKKHFDISYTLPSGCAEALKAGTADIGIIPVAAYASIPGLVVVPDVAIAAKGKVRSILLISKVPAERIRNVATDNSSRTSVALVELFLRKFVGVEPGFVPLTPNQEEMLRWHDACLLIGDPALLAERQGYYVYDLAEQWRNWTGRPFVFAFWAVRQASLRAPRLEVDIARTFQQSRDHGLENVAEIVNVWAKKLSLPLEMVRDYLTQSIDYSLDSENLEGLKLFYRYAAELKLLPAAPEVRFLQT